MRRVAPWSKRRFGEPRASAWGVRQNDNTRSKILEEPPHADAWGSPGNDAENYCCTAHRSTRATRFVRTISTLKPVALIQFSKLVWQSSPRSVSADTTNQTTPFFSRTDS